MSNLLILYLLFVCIGLFAWGMKQPGRMYEFPFLAGVVFSGFVLPQVIGLNNSGRLPPEVLDKVIIMSLLCILACWVGYVANQKPLRIMSWKFSLQRLLVVSTVLSLLGAYFFYLIGRLPEELTAASQWTGLPVAYRFFGGMLPYGFALAVWLFARTGSKWAIGIIIFDSMFYLDRILIAGRRGSAMELFFIVVLAFWFVRGFYIPRVAMALLALAGTILLWSTGDYRAEMIPNQSFSLERAQNIEYMANIKQVFTEGGAELEAAAYVIEAVDQTGGFDYGLSHWNILVANYVPAQLVGGELKQSLMIDLADPLKLASNYTPNTGTTLTGMSDAFRSLWFFGAFEFAFIGIIMSRLYKAAVRKHVVAQLLYMLMITSALHAITHNTGMFVTPWVHMGIFLLPALLWARVRNRRNIVESRSAYI